MAKKEKQKGHNKGDQFKFRIDTEHPVQVHPEDGLPPGFIRVIDDEAAEELSRRRMGQGQVGRRDLPEIV